MGLRGVIDPAERSDLAERVMQARAELRLRLQEDEFAGLVEPFDRDCYNTNMTVAENLLFGTPKDPSFSLDQMAGNAYLRKVLHETGLMQDFVSMGHQLAELMVDLFADVAPESELFEQFSFISADDLPVFRGVLSRTNAGGLDSIVPEDRNMLLSLPFKLVPARHRLGLVDDAMMARLLHARKVFAQGFGDGAPPVEMFDSNTYNAYGSIQDNILFGRLAYGRARSGSLARTLIRETVEKQGLLDAVMEVGFDYQVGIAGSRLTGAQRQKLAISRAVLKRPDILIVDDATAALDSGSQERIRKKLLENTDGRTLIWVGPHAKVASEFDTILVLEGGRVAEQGTFEELNQPGTTLHEMLVAD
jgi:ABC-type sugar transport system ATPase subunit